MDLDSRFVSDVDDLYWRAQMQLTSSDMNSHDSGRNVRRDLEMSKSVAAQNILLAAAGWSQ
jgi:hypothetical protein